tara:strand:+ start:2497 stop:3213 length:717 start_codon:yes stop_codon:yes gene_type:complete
MSCLSGNSEYIEFDREMTRTSVAINESCNSCWTGIKSCFRTLSQESRNFLIDLGVSGLEKTHVGKIIEVKNLGFVDQMPEEYRDGKCFHQIKLADGSKFKLIFNNVNYQDIAEYLEIGKMIRISYKEPDFRVINIFPEKIYKVMDFHDFIDEYSYKIDVDTPIRISFLNDKIQKVEFIDKGLINTEQTENIIKHPKKDTIKYCDGLDTEIITVDNKYFDSKYDSDCQSDSSFENLEFA